MFIFEVPYFVNLLTSLEYDTIYHEHLSYVSVKPLAPFFARFGMRIFDIKEVDIHGGSFRIFVDRGVRVPDERVIARLPGAGGARGRARRAAAAALRRAGERQPARS